MVLWFGYKERFAFIITILLLTNIVILLTIPFLRQIAGFLFLTFLPGFLILQILKLNKLSIIEKIILSWGLSISFLMFFGLFINSLLLSLGYETPLATIPLLVSFNIASIVLVIILYKLNETMDLCTPTALNISLKNYLLNFKLTTSEKAFLIVPILFPALSIFGMHVMNTTDNNIILMFLLFLIPSYIVFACFFNQKFSKRLYPVVIYLISISLLLLLSLRSNHIIGSDTHLEYYFFLTSLDNLNWRVLGYSTFNAILSISLLPTIYQSILDINPEFLFKTLYSVIYSISPLIIYTLSRKYIGEFYAFLASIFFMSQWNFLFTEYNARTNTAVFFFMLAMMTLFNDKIDPIRKKILFIIFMVSTIVSHYSTTYIVFFIIFGAFIGETLLSKKYIVKMGISSIFIPLFFALIFLWYSQVSESAFYYGAKFVANTLSNLNEFFIEESRGQVQALLGKDIAQKGIAHTIELIWTWLTFALIAIGVITLIIRHKEMSFPELKYKTQDFLEGKFEVTYFMIALTCSGLLAAMVCLPYLAVGYSLDRLYAVAITILSVFFVIGSKILSKYLKARSFIIILLVFIPYFLSVTGVTYNMLGVPRSIILNSEGEQYYQMYIHDQDSYGAKWLTRHGEINLSIYTDRSGLDLIISQGNRLPKGHSLFTNEELTSCYIYLRYLNSVQGKLLKGDMSMRDIKEIFNSIFKLNKIYDNDAWIYTG